MSIRHFALVALLASSLATVACGGASDDTTTDNGAGTSQDELGKTRYHYTPDVTDVTFHGGCGIATNPPPKDCFYGFALNYSPAYIDLTTTVTHSVDNTAHTLHITVDTWSYSHIHSHVVPSADVDDVGLASAKVGEPYMVTVVDRNSNVLWTGKVNTLFHL
jgi:hypothetical protein